jgi:hypothetical protein
VSMLFDEHKLVFGVNSEEEARDLYLSCYEKNWKGLGSIAQSNTVKIREWLSSGYKNEPFNA